MSSTLSFKPVIPKEFKSLSDDLKYVLIKKFDLNNGTQRLNSSHKEYLFGLMDAGLGDAEKLIDMINNYGEVDIFLTY